MKRLSLLLSFLAIVSCGIAQVKVVAHRGYWETDGSAQNSIRSLVKADSIHAYGSEFDIWLTTDNKLAVNHDAKFKGVVLETATLDDVKGITLDNGETMPLLEEYLQTAQTLPNLRLVLELKALKDKSRENLAVEMISDMLDSYGVKERTDFISFSLNACMEAKKRMPEMKIYYLNGDLGPDKIKDLGFAGIDYYGKTLRANPQWIKEAHDLGLEVNVWTIDNPEDIKYFKDAGVDFITTNRPEEALKIIAE